MQCIDAVIALDSNIIFFLPAVSTILTYKRGENCFRKCLFFPCAEVIYMQRMNANGINKQL